MDTITHSLLGAVTAQLGFRQRLGPGATWVAAGAAAACDLDVLAAPLLRATGLGGGDLSHLSLHRGLSHSLLVVPAIALVIALGWWAVRRRRRSTHGPPGRPGAGAPLGLLYACVFVAVLSHPLLDWCTSYGTQIFAPITQTRYAADVVPIVDVFYTLLLVLALLVCYAVRRLGGGARASLALGWAGFALSVAYLACGGVLHERAAAEVRRLAAPAPVVRADAYPALGSILVWRGVAETEGGWVVAKVRPLAGGAGPPTVIAKESGPWIDRARALPAARTFEWFAMGRVRATCVERDGRRVVELHDMRYGPRPESAESLWPLRVTFSDTGEVLSAERRRTFRRADAWRLVAEAWRDMWGP